MKSKQVRRMNEQEGGTLVSSLRHEVGGGRERGREGEREEGREGGRGEWPEATAGRNKRSLVTKRNWSGGFLMHCTDS